MTTTIHLTPGYDLALGDRLVTATVDANTGHSIISMSAPLKSIYDATRGGQILTVAADGTARTVFMNDRYLVQR